MTFMNETDSIHFHFEFTLIIFGFLILSLFNHVVIVNIVPAITFVVYEKAKSNLIQGVILSLSLGGKQVKKERSEENILCQYSRSFLLNQ